MIPPKDAGKKVGCLLNSTVYAFLDLLWWAVL